jgi:hypothetical protein
MVRTTVTLMALMLSLFATASVSASITYNYIGQNYDILYNPSSSQPYGTHIEATITLTSDDPNIWSSDPYTVPSSDILSWSIRSVGSPFVISSTTPGYGVGPFANGSQPVSLTVIEGYIFMYDISVSVYDPTYQKNVILNAKYPGTQVDVTIGGGFAYWLYDSAGDCIISSLSSGSTGIATTLGSWSGPPVPIPAAIWLLGSGLIGLAGVRRFRK